MKISKIISQHRRDFQAVYVCEHCGAEETRGGYDDKHFHANVIPDMECESCGKKAPENYRPLTTRHEEGDIV